MSRLLHETSWYEPLHPGAMYELSYEALVLSRSEHLFPDYLCTRFNKVLNTPLGDVQADLALIERQYRRWYVVEVELASHSLSGHVLPQVERLMSARYGHAEATWIAARDTEIDGRRLQRLVEEAAPEIMVVVNASLPEWHSSVRAAGARLAVIEPYRSRTDRLILRVLGDGPKTVGPILTTVEAGVGWLRSMVRVASPAALGHEADETVDVLYRGQALQMRVKAIGGATYLKATAYDLSLAPNWRATLVRRTDGWLELVDH